MNTQFKKGVLELIVLLVIQKSDVYGYELVSKVNEVVNVNEGTIYPILKRLTVDNYCNTYLKESNEGPSRKYYHLTETGKVYLNNLLTEWLSFSKEVNEFIERNMKDE